MPNFDPHHPPLNFLILGEKFLSPQHIAAIHPIPHPRDEAGHCLRVELSGGRFLDLIDDEVVAMLTYFGYRKAHDPCSFVDLGSFYEEFHKDTREDAERAALSGGLATVPNFVPLGDVVMRVDDSTSVLENVAADPGPQNRRYFL